MFEFARHFDARKVLILALVGVITIGLALMVGAVAILATGDSPLDAYRQLFLGAFGTTTAIATTLTRSIPIIITGIGMGLAWRAGFFNIGGEGQMIMGALVTAVTAHALTSLSPVLLLPMSILAGCAAGGLWALLAGWWQARLRVPVLITTLLLNYIAALFAAYLVTYPLRDRTHRSALAQTVMIPGSIQLPILVSGTPLHAGVLIVPVLALVVAWSWRRTVLGYGMRMTGLNPSFAEYGGVNMGRTIMTTMFFSGGICGLAGAIEVLGVFFRYIDGSVNGPGTAWTGFIAGLLALANPISTIFTGLFLGALNVGAAGMESNTNVPLQLANVIQAAIIFMIAMRLMTGRILRRLIRFQ